VTILVIVLCLAVQLIPVRQANPPVIGEPAWDTPETRALAVRACFDCHSNETKWPFYAHIAPISWLVARDAVAGRSRLNFSEWNAPGKAQQVGEIGETIREGEMPPWFYLPMHPEARLSAADKEALIQGLNNTMANSPPQ
jgi:hypothetical protein